MAARILLADDFDIVRRGIRGLLDGPPGWEICGEAVNGREAVEKTLELKPDLVVLDVGMPIMNGIEAARQIRAFATATKILKRSQSTGSTSFDRSRQPERSALVVVQGIFDYSDWDQRTNISYSH